MIQALFNATDDRYEFGVAQFILFFYDFSEANDRAQMTVVDQKVLFLFVTSCNVKITSQSIK